MSEPGTLADLGENVHKVYTNPQFAKTCGVYFDAFKNADGVCPCAFQLIQGIQHVDDALVFSKVFCSFCLFDIVRNMWPSDVGVKHEASTTPLGISAT